MTFAAQKRTISPVVKTAYFHYFGVKVGDQDKPWAPHVCCNSCSVKLREWLNGKKRAMKFAVPMVWREPTNHVDDCYFCLTPSLKQGWSTKKKAPVEYPCVPSAIRPVPHSADLPIPEPPQNYEIEKDDAEGGDDLACEEEVVRPGTSHDPDFKAEGLDEPHRLNQRELSDLIRDLDLPKEKSELLGSRLKQWHLLQPGVKITEYRTRQKNLLHFFEKKEHLVACIDVNGLMNSLNITHDPIEWRLFILFQAQFESSLTTQR